MPRLVIKACDVNNTPMSAKVVLTITESLPDQNNESELKIIRYIDGLETFIIEYKTVHVGVFCGKLYKPVYKTIKLPKCDDSDIEITAVMEKIVNPSQYGLFSFDAHNHVSRKYYDKEKTIGLREAANIAKGEDLNVFFAGVPYDYENHKEKKTGSLISEVPYRKRYESLLNSVKSDSFIEDIGNEYCKYRYGHVFMFNYEQKPPVNKYRDALYYPYEMARQVPNTKEPEFTNTPISNAVFISKEDNSVAAYAHPTSWWYDEENLTIVTNIASTIGFDILTGAIDAVVIMGYKPDHMFYQYIWYELLDNGYFVTGIAETDACLDRENFEMPPYKTYAHIETLTLDELSAAVKAGRCMVTSGPLLHFTVNDYLPGSRIERIVGKSYSIKIMVEACYEAPLSKIQIILNGKVRDEINIEGENKYSNQIVLENIDADSYVHAKCYDMAGNVAISNPVFIRNTPFVNIDYRSQVSIDVYKDGIPATGLFRVDKNGDEKYFNDKINCSIRPHEAIYIKVEDETRKVELFYLEPIQKIFRHLYTGEFNKDKKYEPGEVPAEAFCISEIKSILDQVYLRIDF